MSFSDLFSDDDEEFIEFLSRPMRQIFERSNLFESLPDDKFIRRFRLSKCSATYLLHQIASKLISNTDRNNAVSPMNQLLCTLRYYATGSLLISCGDMIGIHESTACCIVHRVTHAIASLYQKCRNNK